MEKIEKNNFIKLYIYVYLYSKLQLVIGCDKECLGKKYQKD